MHMSHGDLFDRWTILRMKARLDRDAAKDLRKYDKEIRRVVQEARDYDQDVMVMLPEHIAQLAEANAKIWVSEASIRKEYSDDPAAQEDLSLEEVGRRALEIRDYNKLRVEAKKALDFIFGDTPDNKVDHASQ